MVGLLWVASEPGPEGVWETLTLPLGDCFLWDKAGNPLDTDGAFDTVYLWENMISAVCCPGVGDSSSRVPVDRHG